VAEQLAALASGLTDRDRTIRLVFEHPRVHHDQLASTAPSTASAS
jgi:hypothetical protein